jgi:hypothetical protein
VFDYQHPGFGDDPTIEGNCIIGGYVYRGPDPELQGQYIFADFSTGQFWMFDPVDPYGTVQNITDMLLPSDELSDGVTSFWEDDLGNLYVGTLRGNLFQLMTDARLPGDIMEDGQVNALDLAFWRTHFGRNQAPAQPPGDANGDGTVDGADFLLWQKFLGQSVNQTSYGADPTPEPNSGLLITLCGALMLFNRRQLALNPSLAD